jgi:lipopolysaccharide/colanic/teichoic acid biosynthesis glycosyltransferase
MSDSSNAAPGARHGLPRAADLALAVASLIVASPVLLAAAVAIKLGSRGPVIYRQPRVGKDGVVFDLFKLRTMREGADPVGVGTAVIEGDPRVTRVGRLLRRFALDELPNLANVLRGEMAMVGPRATLPAQVELYTPRQRRRLELKPGVTGWAQTHGRAGIPWEERIELDVWYVENRSIRLDLRILAQTPLALLRGFGMTSPDPYAGSPPDSPLRQAAEREQAGQAKD